MVALSYVVRFPGCHGIFWELAGRDWYQVLLHARDFVPSAIESTVGRCDVSRARWWFQHFFLFTPTWGFSILTNIFQRGWFNQQRESDGFQLMWLKRLGFWEVTGPIKFFLFDVAKQMVFLQTKVDSVVVSLFVWGLEMFTSTNLKRDCTKTGPRIQLHSGKLT